MKRKTRLISIFLMLILLLSACTKEKSSDQDSAGSYAEDSMGNNMENESKVTSDGIKEEMPEAAMDNSVQEGEQATVDAEAGEANKTVQVDSGRKLIRTFNLSAETKDFDKVVKIVEEKILELGGYKESFTEDGNQLSNGSNRTCQFVARIPKEKIDAFVSSVGITVNVVNKAETTQDVTLEYVDMESHQKALKVEYDRLLAILEKAKTLEDIIALESRLSQVRYELDYYESQIRTYDNLVDYATVTLTINEVERVTAIDNETTADKMKNGIEDSLYNIGNGFKNFVVWFVVNLPYLLIWVIVLLVGFFGIRKWLKMNDKKNKIKEIKFIEQKNNIKNQFMEKDSTQGNVLNNIQENVPEKTQENEEE